MLGQTNFTLLRTHLLNNSSRLYKKFRNSVVHGFHDICQNYHLGYEW